MTADIINLVKTWRKTIWWAILLLVFSSYIWINLNRILSQNPLPIDYIIVILLLLLLLLPLASEIDFLGFSIKKEIESVKTELKSEIVNLRTEIHNTTSINIQNIPQPLPDEKLKEIELRYSKLSEKLNSAEKISDEDPLDNLEIPKTVKNIAGVRIILEKELLRIYKERFGDRDPHRNIVSVTRILTQEGLIDSITNMLITEIRAISNNAVHGGLVTPEQYNFVKTMFPPILEALKEI